MGLLKSFSGFVNRVVKAGQGNLDKTDMVLLKHLLSRTSERNLILARGLLSALTINHPKKSDIEMLANILDNANIRTLKSKQPFTEKEEKIISKMFEKYGLSPKVAEWMASQRDAFLYNKIKEEANRSVNTEETKATLNRKKKIVYIERKIRDEKKKLNA